MFTLVNYVIISYGLSITIVLPQYKRVSSPPLFTLSPNPSFKVLAKFKATNAGHKDMLAVLAAVDVLVVAGNWLVILAVSDFGIGGLMEGQMERWVTHC